MGDMATHSRYGTTTETLHISTSSKQLQILTLDAAYVLEAVKKLHRFEREYPTFDSSFRNEAKLLSQIRHRHIVKLFGFCLHQWSMFLIYDYMERGSLFSMLKYEDEAMEEEGRCGEGNCQCIVLHAALLFYTQTFRAATNSWIQSLKVVYLILGQLDCWIQIHPIRQYLWELGAILHQVWYAYHNRVSSNNCIHDDDMFLGK